MLASAAGTLSVSHATSGVAAATYGNSTAVFQGVVDARGHITAGTHVPIVFPAGGTSTATFTGDALGTATIPGGPTGLTLSTTGVVAGTYGGANILARFDISAQGRVVSGTNMGTVGTMAFFSSLVGAGDVLGTSTTNTFTGALSTTGVTAGTYGNSTSVAQPVVDAKGRITSISNVGIAGASAAITIATYGTGFTLSGTNNGQSLVINNGGNSVVVVTTGLGVGFNCLITGIGTGTVSVSTAGGVGLQARGGALKLNGQYAAASVIPSGTDSYVLAGDLTT